MALEIHDRVKETTTTTGTGTYTLAGAVTGFETFTANLDNSDTTYYACTDNTDFEVGLGTFTSSGTTLARTTILASSNSNNAVNWSSGTRTIFMTYPADKAVFEDASGHVSIPHDLFIAGGLIDLKNDGGAVSQIKFYCESSNAHAQTLIGAPHSESASNTLTLPSSGGSARLVSTASTATLTNKSIDSDNNTITNIVNADIKSSAAIANSKLANSSITVADPSSSTAISLGETITFLGTTNEVEVSEGSGTITVGLPNNVTIAGNLTVNGTTTTIDTTNTLVKDSLLGLNNGASSNSNDSGIIIERGSTGNDALLIWDESADKWALGTTTSNASSTGNLNMTTGTLVANIEGNVTGDVTGNTSGTAATVTGAAQSNITSLGTLTGLAVNGDVTITSTDGGATDDPSLILYRNSSSPADSDDLGEILFRGRNDNSQDVECGCACIVCA